MNSESILEICVPFNVIFDCIGDIMCKSRSCDIYIYIYTL